MEEFGGMREKDITRGDFFPLKRALRRWVDARRG